MVSMCRSRRCSTVVMLLLDRPIGAKMAHRVDSPARTRHSARGIPSGRVLGAMRSCRYEPPDEPCAPILVQDECCHLMLVAPWLSQGPSRDGFDGIGVQHQAGNHDSRRARMVAVLVAGGSDAVQVKTAGVWVPASRSAAISRRIRKHRLRVFTRSGVALWTRVQGSQLRTAVPGRGDT